MLDPDMNGDAAQLSMHNSQPDLASSPTLISSLDLARKHPAVCSPQPTSEHHHTPKPSLRMFPIVRNKVAETPVRFFVLNK